LGLAQLEVRHVARRRLGGWIEEPSRERGLGAQSAGASEVRPDRRPGGADGVAAIAALVGEELAPPADERLPALGVDPGAAESETHCQEPGDHRTHGPGTGHHRLQGSRIVNPRARRAQTIGAGLIVRTRRIASLNPPSFVRVTMLEISAPAPSTICTALPSACAPRPDAT